MTCPVSVAMQALVNVEHL